MRFRRRNWDADFYADLNSGNAFIISEPAEVSLDGIRQKSLYGANSPLYGTSYEDQRSFAERYRCECGEFTSRIFEHEICPKCGTPVEFRDTDIMTTGWITLGDNHIISPYYYHLLESALGSKYFTDTIIAKYKITVDGKRILPREGDLDEDPLTEYSGIGIDQFYKRYEEIMEFFKGLRKNNIDDIDKLIKQKRKVFVSHIPIPSILLRPQSISGDNFYFTTIDKLINTTYSLSENLKRCMPVEKDLILQRLQIKVCDMWEVYFSELNGKDMLIRGSLLGGSINFSSRNVIIPSPDLHDDEVDLSYHTFRELFKYRIIYYIMRLEDVTLSKAYSIWKKSAIFDEKVYDIMEFIIQRTDTRILINRNPTLNYYSMILMRVRKVKPDGGDFALSVPLSILPGLNADWI